MTLSTLNKLRQQSGFTLVELLIVMLIVGILSIAMLPMYKKYMTKAKYTAEGLPILATIKTQVDLDIYDKSSAPGVSGTVYTWITTSDGYQPKQYDLTSTKPVADASLDVTDVAKHICHLVKESELQGRLIRPNHVYYACINQGKALATDPTDTTHLGGDYAYAIGVFGDGNGLPQNSGVATMEVRLGSATVGKDEDGNELTGATILGTWENFDGSGLEGATEGTYGQIRFAHYDATRSANLATMGGVCEIWDKSDVDGLNTGSSMTDIADKVKELLLCPCGEWTFPDLKNWETP